MQLTGTDNITRESLFSICMFGDKLYYVNTSGMGADELISTYAHCDKPFIEMNRYGKFIGSGGYAYKERQHDTFDFSVEFNADEDSLKVYDGCSMIYKSLSRTVAKLNANDENQEKSSNVVKLRHGR